MKITINGTIAEIGALQTFRSGFEKRTVEILDGGNAERPLAVDFSGQRLSLLDGFAGGDDVEIDAILSGRHWHERIFLSLGALAIRRAASARPASEQAPAAPTAPVAPAPPVAPQSRDADDITDNLPF